MYRELMRRRTKTTKSTNLTDNQLPSEEDKDMASASQTQEGRAGVGGATSPLGPDSTWAGAEAGDIAGAKMEARFAQLEQRLLQDSEERFKLMEHHMIMMLKNIQKTNEFCETIVKREDSQSAKTQKYLEKFLPLLENDMNLTKTLENMQEKIDLLLGGENEANKLIDSIAPNVEKTRSDMKKMEKELLHKIDKSYDEVKKIRDEQKSDQSNIRDILHNSKRSREEQNERCKIIEKGLHEISRAVNKRERDRSRSESSENRHRHNSRGSRSPSRSRKRGRGNSRETSISSLNRSKTEQEIEKKLSTFGDNFTTINNSITEMKKDFGLRKEVENQMLSNIVKVVDLLQSQEPVENTIKIPASKWDDGDDDRSPSPISSIQRLARSPLKLPKPPKESKKKKKRVRSASSSSSSSGRSKSSGKSPNFNAYRSQKKNDNIDARSMEVIVSTVSSIEKKFAESMKNLKISMKKSEENNKTTLDRVGEMTVGVQIIAENLDSVNDVARKMRLLEKFETNIGKLDDLDKLSQLDKVWEEINSIRSLVLQSQQGVQNVPVHLPPPLPVGDDGGWEEPLRPPPPPIPPPGAGEMNNMVKITIEESMLGVSSFIEDISDKLSKKIDSIARTDADVPDLLRRLRKLEDGSKSVKTEYPNSPVGLSSPSQGMMQSSPLSDIRASQLEKKLTDISPKLDDLYIRVLPMLVEIKATLKKDNTFENSLSKDVKELDRKIEKMYETFEDFTEDWKRDKSDRGPGSLDRRISNVMETDKIDNKLHSLESTINRQLGDCLNALVDMRTFCAKQSSIDKLEKLVCQQREENPFGNSSEGDMSRVEKRLTTMLEFMKKQEKSMDMFIKNSNSDAKLLSSINTALQSMKAVVNGNGKEVMLAITGLGDQLREAETALGDVKTNLSGLGGSIDDIGGQVRNIDREAVCSGEEIVSKLQSSIDKLASSVKNIEKSGRQSSSSRRSSDKEESPVTVEEIEVKKSNENNNFQEEFKSAIVSLRSEIKRTDTNVAKAVKNLANLLNSTVELQQKTNSSLSDVESNIKTSIEETFTELKDHVNGHQADDNKGNSHNDSSAKIDAISNRLDKLSKIISRVKFLLEDGSDEEDGKKKKKRHSTDSNVDFGELEKLLTEVNGKLDSSNSLVQRFDCLDEKIDKISRGSADRKIDDLSGRLGELGETISRRIEDDLSLTVEKVNKMASEVQEIQSVLHEVGERMITSKLFKNSQSDIISRVSDLQVSIANIPDEFGSQAAAMEENLCHNVENCVKDVFKSHWDELMVEIEQILGKLSSIKRFVKYRSREGSVDGEDSENSPSLESVMSKVNEVTDKLSGVQGAIEAGILGSGEVQGGGRDHLGTALLLEEIRKKVDISAINSFKKEMFTTVHNVQNRLLEEQVRLINNLGEARKESSQPTMLTLIECLNKVRESQNLIVSTQNLGFTSQTATNKILADVVTNLDSTTSLLERFGDNSPSFKFTSKMSELCDDIRSAVNGLYTAQDQLSSCTSNSMQQLDKLIKSANHIMREDTWNTKKRLSVSTDGGPASKRRMGGGGIKMVVKVNRDNHDVQNDSCGGGSPASEAGQDEWGDTEVKQPTVRLRAAILSPRQREEAKRSLGTQEDNEDELRDEFASPEKQ